MPLTTQRFADLAELFNEGGDPKWCWCMYFRTAGLDWTNSTTAGNRSALERLAGRDLAPGLVGYRDGRVVGWVSLAPREDYGRLETSKVLARVDDTPVWSIVCFVVSKKVRGQGVAAALLEAAIAFARERGAKMLEAYPVSATRGRVSPSSAFHGTESMYERAGFTVVEMRQGDKSSPLRPIMRLSLTQTELAFRRRGLSSCPPWKWRLALSMLKLFAPSFRRSHWSRTGAPSPFSMGQAAPRFRSG